MMLGWHGSDQQKAENPAAAENTHYLEDKRAHMLKKFRWKEASMFDDCDFLASITAGIGLQRCEASARRNFL